MNNQSRKRGIYRLKTLETLQNQSKWQTVLSGKSDRQIYRQPRNISRNIFWLVPSCLLSTLLLVAEGNQAIASQTSDLSSISPIAQVSETSDLLQQGEKFYQAGQFTEAIAVWETALIDYQNQGRVLQEIQTLNYLALGYKDLGQIQTAQATIDNSFNQLEQFNQLDKTQGLLSAQALNIHGTLQLLKGQTETALEIWKNASKTYELAGDQTGQIISQINQAQALQVLGQKRRAKSLLEEQLATLNEQPDSLLKAQGLRSLGIALQNLGVLGQAKTVLEQSWELSKQFNSPADVSTALFSIGNVARELQQYPVAWTYYEQAAKLSVNPLNQLEIQLNQLKVLIDAQRWQPALGMIPKIQASLEQLVPSRPAIYGRINLAENLLKLQRLSESSQLKLNFNHQDIAEIIAVGIQQAREIEDARSEAYGLYQLGRVYQEKGQYIEAENLTQQSIEIGQQISAIDINARAGVQLGGILKQEGKQSEAIAAYEIAFDNLQSLRSDLVATNTDIQFDFKENIEPFYREFVNLLLQQDDSQANLRQAREVMEALQLAELDNFFQDACLDTYPVTIDEIDPTAAVVYPIILRDRLEVIISIPNQPLRHYSSPVDPAQVDTVLKQFYSALSPGYPRDEQLQIGQQIYSWLVQPAEALLNQYQIKTLVFVPDGFLRSVPMAALFDGQQYLIEKYSVVLSPGLQLFPQGLQRQENFNALAVGLTEARQGFNPLPGVKEEMEKVTLNLNSQVFLNEEFTLNSLKDAINRESYPIIHLATHGQFSSNPEETFLLTWNDRISMQDFDLLFEKRRVGLLEPIELLVMSACQTAAGDRRAALGLAGFALRSGAKSTLGSFWSVSDESTSELMGEFYHQLANGEVSKAEALRQAQLNLLKNPSFKHPYFWSAFVLVGNWL